jgi:hypothetical protein
VTETTFVTVGMDWTMGWRSENVPECAFGGYGDVWVTAACSWVFVTRIGEPAESVVEIREWDWRIQPTVVDSSSAKNHISASR